jgi:hypothetical protein
MTLWIIGFLDVSRDFPVHWLLRENNDLNMPESFSAMSGGILSVDNLIALQLPVDIGSTAIIVFLAVIGLLTVLMGKNGFRAGPEVKWFLILFILSNFMGGIIGLIKDVPYKYVMGDARNLIVYPMLFAIREGMTEQGVDKLRKLFLISCFILTLKLLLTFFFTMSFGVLSWRSLFKQTVFFMPMLFLGLVGATLIQQKKERFKYVLISLLAGFGIIAASSRAMFVGTLVGIIFITIMLLNNRRIYRLFILGVVVFVMMLVVGMSLQDDPAKAFGRWSEDLPGIADDLSLRWRQLDMLITRFGNNWLVGTGLGYFDETSEFVLAYGPRPYLLELELVNLMSKLGIIGISLWVTAFLSLFVGCIRAVRRAAKPEHRVFLLGLTAGLVSLMVGSIFHVNYSSAYFHLYVVMIILVLSALRAPKLARFHSNLFGEEPKK